jgi:predicted metalloendopeptidase
MHFYLTQVDGYNKLAENIADNVGFSQALLAYRSFVQKNGAEPRLPNFEQFTQEQLFTLGFANVC